MTYGVADHHLPYGASMLSVVLHGKFTAGLSIRVGFAVALRVASGPSGYKQGGFPIKGPLEYLEKVAGGLLGIQVKFSSSI